MRANASVRLKPLMIILFAIVLDLDFHEIGTEKIWQVFCASFAAVAYAEKDPHVRNFFYTLLRAGQRSVANLNGGQLLQMAPNSAWRGFVATLESTAPSVFNVLIFSLHSRGRVCYSNTGPEVLPFIVDQGAQ